jgi:hypothetical protein
MIRTLKTWLTTVREVLTNFRALIIFAALYALLLASTYVFSSTREATIWQVFITFFSMVLIPAEFFILQAAIVDHTREQRFRWPTIVFDALKFFVATIPIFLLGWLIYYLLNKWQAHYPAPIVPAVQISAAPLKPRPIHWPTMLFSTVRLLLFGVILPLTAIHLWIRLGIQNVRSVFAGGPGVTLKRIGGALGRAIASDSVMIYALGLIIFVLVPYAILYVPSPAKGTKTDFAFFVLRLLLAFIFTLIGWLVTVKALTRNSAASTDTVSTAPVPSAPMEAPA